MLTLEQAREALRLDSTDNDAIIAGLLAAIPDYIELCTGVTAEKQANEPLADTASKFILILWYHAERVDADKVQRTIDSVLKALQLKAVQSGGTRAETEIDYTLLKNKPRLNGREIVGDIQETDPTISEWAKAETRPEYTAEDVGALSKKDVQNISIQTLEDFWKG